MPIRFIYIIIAIVHEMQRATSAFHVLNSLIIQQVNGNKIKNISPPIAKYPRVLKAIFDKTKNKIMPITKRIP